ncbi:amino acid ABC transporter substrate-binding protein [Scleromatobacter humisilvae]|uniref:Amino acid ABC transporter substrate-binding protein n=1 Tax=Scleromatobacter humisilvae TaxID=2897159 RepID=A0A9X1YL87_9BURK|nr:amino acid ABC transporter substrate-binding protein [Scleromatobacter humisilvae]MCK9688238.1 amino acid ABC transporter substrate-binding protein [Scleromatobacter humisilvae]
MHLFLHNSASRAIPEAAAVLLIPALAAALVVASPAQAKSRADAAAASASQAVDAEPHPVLDRIRSTGKIVLAHRESSVPFSYYDANKKPVGYAIDLCKDVAEAVRKHLGLKTIEIAYVPITTANRIDTIASGKADLECGATTNNAERRQKVAFTIPHYITGTRFAVRADSPIAELNQFEHHVLVSTAGSTPFKSVDQANKDRLLGIDVKPVKDNAEAMAMLANKSADGFAMDDVQLYGLIAESPVPSQFKVVGKFITIEPLAIMLSKDDAAFKKVVDDEMRHLIRSGEGEKIYNRWFMAPIPPRNVTMNLPMSYLLRDSWKYPSDAVAN